MPKAKQKQRRRKYNYNINRKKLNKAARKKAAPRIKCHQIRHAWDRSKTVSQNLAEMGLAVDPNKAVPIPKGCHIEDGARFFAAAPENRTQNNGCKLQEKRFHLNIRKNFLMVMRMDVDGQETKTKIVRKPYVINELEYEASLPEKKSETLSKDLIDYVQHMIRSHGENYKAMARDEKNYYQDTPKQIKRKINVYKRFYPEEYKTFVDSLQQEKMDQQ